MASPAPAVAASAAPNEAKDNKDNKDVKQEKIEDKKVFAAKFAQPQHEAFVLGLDKVTSCTMLSPACIV